MYTFSILVRLSIHYLLILVIYNHQKTKLAGLKNLVSSCVSRKVFRIEGFLEWLLSVIKSLFIFINPLNQEETEAETMI